MLFVFVLFSYWFFRGYVSYGQVTLILPGKVRHGKLRSALLRKTASRSTITVSHSLKPRTAKINEPKQLAKQAKEQSDINYSSLVGKYHFVKVKRRKILKYLSLSKVEEKNAIVFYIDNRVIFSTLNIFLNES